MRARAGFTILEAMISLAIAGFCLTAIFGLQHALVDGQKHHERALEQVVVRRNALAMIRDLNIDVTPQGDVDLPPNFSLHWTATALGDRVLSANFPAGDGTYYVTLYRLAVEVDDPSGAAVDSFNVERWGWTSQAQAAADLTGVAAAAAPPTVNPGRAGQ